MKGGFTALMLAANNNNTSIVGTLIAAHADVNIMEKVYFAKNVGFTIALH